MKNLTIESIPTLPVSERAVEIVERKGRGHPDSICDAIMEAVSLALSREYIRLTGRVLHHNIDKGLLVAGEASKKFGGGAITSPMELIIGDRATFTAGKIEIPVEEIARKAAVEWITENLPCVDIDHDIKIRVALGPGSPELTGIFNTPGPARLSNDTSVAVGLAPFTTTERAVLDLENHINSAEFKKLFPETGSDVKIMGVRTGASLDLTVACPLFVDMIESEREYFARKEDIIRGLEEFTTRRPFDIVNLHYNSLDTRGIGEAGVYMTLLGTSAEDGDSGEVGRGNSVRGVIAMNRSGSAEAAAGKNPVSHVGKIYSILAQKMAEQICTVDIPLKEVAVFLVSRIGRPVDEPACIYVQVIPDKGYEQERACREIRAVIEKEFASLDTLIQDLLKGKYPMC